jgi:hypothetical protein
MEDFLPPPLPGFSLRLFEETAARSGEESREGLSGGPELTDRAHSLSSQRELTCGVHSQK